MGNRFYIYNPSTENCQDFILQMLKSNGINDEKAFDFIKQDTSMIFKNKGWLSGMAKQITDIGGVADVVMQGGSVNGQSNELSDSELKDLVKYYKIKRYHGCFIDDRMPEKLLNGFYIINLNGHSHWTCLLKDGGDFFYFDSYGFPASAEVEELIGTDYIHSDLQIQNMNSSSCGYFCIAFMRSMEKAKNKKKAYEDFLKHFDKDPLKNEVLLHELLDL